MLVFRHPKNERMDERLRRQISKTDALLSSKDVLLEIGCL